MYALNDYARMVADRTRTAAYVRALEAIVRAGSVVVDVGTGTGLMALVACRLGARRVYAIELNPAIEVARELARENGFEDRIQFLQEDALAVDLPERGDVVVSDLRGSMPLAPGNLAVIAHARDHFLLPGGTVIPRQDVMKVAVVDASVRYEQAVGPTAVGGVTLGAMRRRLTNEVHRDRARSLQASDLVTPGAIWAVVDYSRGAQEPFLGQVEWTVDRPRIGHGLLLWFDALLVGSEGFSTEPGSEVANVYPQPFLPWTEPIALHAGDRVAVKLWAQHDGEPWGWNTTVATAKGSLRAEYKQSSFLSAMAPPVRSDASGGPTRSQRS